MSWSNLILVIRVVLDIIVLWSIFYAGIRIVRNNTRTVQIVKGILALLIFKFIADVLHLKTVSSMLEFVLSWGMIVVLIILQPEIRTMLEKMGKTNSWYRPDLSAERTKHLVDELVKAVSDMSKTKTGAIISLEMGQSLEDYVKTGVSMDSDVTSEVLETIFQYGTPVHDGAVIIKGDKIACASAYFPSTAKDLPTKYGARHRAAVGVSEVSDAITLVVSEETGNISIAQKGILTQYTPESLHRYLTSRLVVDTPSSSSSMHPVLETARHISTNVSNSLSRNNKKYVLAPEKKDDRVKPLSVVNLLETQTSEKSTQKSSTSKKENGHEK